MTEPPNNLRPPGRRDRIDSYFDDHSRWSWLDLAAGLALGATLGVVGAISVIRELATQLAACRG